jgi:hypothetical protein
VRRWRSPLVTLTMFASLWALGSAVAPIGQESVQAPQTLADLTSTTPPEPVLWLDPDPLEDPPHSERLACVDEVCPDSNTDAADWKTLVSRYFKTEHVDRALRIIRCESGSNASAANSISGAAGLFQHLPRYWAGRAEAAGFAGASIFNAEANIAAAAWLVYHGGGWAHWAASSSCWQ